MRKERFNLDAILDITVNPLRHRELSIFFSHLPASKNWPEEQTFLSTFGVVYLPQHGDLYTNLTRYRGTRRQFSENICSEDDLRFRIFGTLLVKFLACLPLLGFLNI